MKQHAIGRHRQAGSAQDLLRFILRHWGIWEMQSVIDDFRSDCFDTAESMQIGPRFPGNRNEMACLPKTAANVPLVDAPRNRGRIFSHLTERGTQSEQIMYIDHVSPIFHPRPPSTHTLTPKTKTTFSPLGLQLPP